MKTNLVLSMVFALMLFSGCGEQKVQSVQVAEWQEYRDPGFGFTIRYPKDWMQLGTTGQAVFAKSQEVLDKFRDPRAGIEGGAAAVDVTPFAGKKAEEIISQTLEDLKANNAEIDSGTGPNAQVTVGGRQARVIGYRIQATTKTSIYGEYIFVPGDTAMYRLNFEGYGNQYAAHQMVFDSMRNSFQVPVVVARKADVWNPAQGLYSYSTKYFTIRYPENMEDVPVKPAGNNEFAMEVRADRRDCSIHIDVFGAKGLSVDKVWDQNKGRYRAKGTGTSTIDGNKAYWVDYSLVKDVNSRAYFVVKNNQVIRVSLNWYAPQKDIYFPVFEKAVTTLKLK